MSIRQQQLPNDAWLISVRGRLDQNLNPQLEEQLNGLLNDGQYRLIVDLTGATYINSGGLRYLVSAWRKARRQNGDLLLCGLNVRLTEIFSIVGFDKVFRIYPDSETAQQASQT